MWPIELLIAIAIVNVGLGLYVFFSLSRVGWRAWTGPGLFGLLVVVQLLVIRTILGFCNPATFTTDVPLRVYAFHLVEPVSIYLLAGEGDNGSPRCYVLPWGDGSQASELAKAQRVIAGTSGTVTWQSPEDSQEDGGPTTFHAQPPRSPPPKTP